MFGSRCTQCGASPIEMHHVKFRSRSGKGVWRNLNPLCKHHHAQTHDNPKLIQISREIRTTQFGEYYWCDKWDLFKLGLIEDPDDEEFEAFMKSQEYKEPEHVPGPYDHIDFPF